MVILGFASRSLQSTASNSLKSLKMAPKRRIFLKKVWRNFFIIVCHQLKFFFIFFKYALRIFFSLKAHCFWLGIICYLLATRGQRLPGAVGAQTLYTQIPCLMPWQSATATPTFIFSLQSYNILMMICNCYYIPVKVILKQAANIVYHPHLSQVTSKQTAIIFLIPAYFCSSASMIYPIHFIFISIIWSSLGFDLNSPALFRSQHQTCYSSFTKTISPKSFDKVFIGGFCHVSKPR